ncbi:Fungal Zn binuclear cluster domain containing protein [Fusarium falciforme]|uniref:Fungal Zn binuclear cluster domain containing protein n=1 Tax=Fusarium falciforme TaxID=195108 RepID=UPI0023015892|nr:Fungal Zn binuclear cluster domain containing protein [Fusarium falciforme]WAO97230.1 Fungal Zn binuclear cluster domain containing protein [Fusarium falciforme]
MGTTNKSYMTVHPFLSQQTSTIDSDNARTVSLPAHGLNPIFGDSFSVTTKSPSRSLDPESQQQQQCRLGGRKGRKGRKKLDYRRTSVACDPCRRRKIRSATYVACEEVIPAILRTKRVTNPIVTRNFEWKTGGTTKSALHPPGNITGTKHGPYWERGTVQRPGSEMAALKTIWGSHPSGSPISAQIPPFAPIPPNWTSGSSGPGSHDDVAWGNYASLLRSMSFGSVSPNSMSWEVELQAMPTWTHSVAQPGPRDEVPGWGPPYRNTIVVSSTDGGAEGGVVEPRESVYT